jgi:Predicted UDP-glucose 6-dehydrogenase
MADKIISKSKLRTGETATILGLSFKPNTDDIRDSTSIKIAKILNQKGIKVKSYDPEAMSNAKKENPFLVLCDDAYIACEESKAIIIGTEWNEFRALDLKKIINNKNNLCIFDLRNIYNPKELKQLGFDYFGTGT